MIEKIGSTVGVQPFCARWSFWKAGGRNGTVCHTQSHTFFFFFFFFFFVQNCKANEKSRNGKKKKQNCKEGMVIEGDNEHSSPFR